MSDPFETLEERQLLLFPESSAEEKVRWLIQALEADLYGSGVLSGMLMQGVAYQVEDLAPVMTNTVVKE